MKVKKEIILHIDDNSSNRYTIKRMLEKAGYQVISAENGQTGLNLASSVNPDLIILDIELPDISGLKVCKQLKENAETNSFPILQTSATFVSNKNIVAGLDSGADGYLAQPVEAIVLIATVKSLLRTRRAEIKAHQATQAREEMMAIVSHDLRNPLTHIILQTSVLKHHINDQKIDPERFTEKLNKINESCNRMNHLIKDLMDINQMDGGKFSIIAETLDTRDLINDIHKAFDEQASAYKVQLVLNSPITNIHFEADRARLLQVLGNLIANSLKFTSAGGKITLNFEQIETELHMTLEDTGQGIAAKDLHNIFDRYWQGRTERKHGIGLGLSIVKGIVDAHHGSIKLSSEPGVGTRFEISLPLKQLSSQPALSDQIIA